MGPWGTDRVSSRGILLIVRNNEDNEDRKKDVAMRGKGDTHKVTSFPMFDHSGGSGDTMEFWLR